MSMNITGLLVQCSRIDHLVCRRRLLGAFGRLLCELHVHLRLLVASRCRSGIASLWHRRCTRLAFAAGLLSRHCVRQQTRHWLLYSFYVQYMLSGASSVAKHECRLIIQHGTHLKAYRRSRGERPRSAWRARTPDCATLPTWASRCSSPSGSSRRASPQNPDDYRLHTSTIRTCRNRNSVLYCPSSP